MRPSAFPPEVIQQVKEQIRIAEETDVILSAQIQELFEIGVDVTEFRNKREENRKILNRLKVRYGD